MSRWTAKLKALLKAERQSFLAGGRDVVETTRQSILSLEARAGAALLAVFFPLSLAQCPPEAPYSFDPGPAFAGGTALFVIPAKTGPRLRGGDGAAPPWEARSEPQCTGRRSPTAGPAGRPSAEANVRGQSHR